MPFFSLCSLLSLMLIYLTSLDLYMLIFDVLFANINWYLLLKIRDKKINFLIQLTSIIAKCLFLCLGQVQSSGEVLYLSGNNHLNYKASLPTFYSSYTWPLGASLPFQSISISFLLGSPWSPPKSDLVTLEVQDLHRGDIWCRIPIVVALVPWLGRALPNLQLVP